MAQYSTNEFRSGLKVMLDGDPCSIVENEFVKSIITQLQEVFSESVAAINEAAETATHEENVAKNKYETKY